MEIAEARAQISTRDAERGAWERALKDAYSAAGRDVVAAVEAAALRGRLASKEAELAATMVRRLTSSGSHLPPMIASLIHSRRA